MEYNGITDKLKGMTRNGSTLEYNKEELIKRFNEREETDINLAYETEKYVKNGKQHVGRVNKIKT